MGVPIALEHNVPISFRTQFSQKVMLIIYFGTLLVLYYTEVIVFDGEGNFNYGRIAFFLFCSTYFFLILHPFLNESGTFNAISFGFLFVVWHVRIHPYGK